MGRTGKMIGSAVSIVLVVGVVIGVVAVVQRGNNKGGGGGGGGGETTASTKTATALCQPTTHKEACAASVQSVANNPNASFQDYLSAALNATMSELNKAIETTKKVSVNKDDDPHNDQMGVDDCKEFLDDAVEQLQAAITSVGKSELHTIQDRMQEFMSWLTGVYVYQTTCVDQLDKPEYKEPVRDGMVNASQLTENAIYIFSEMQKITGSLNLNFTGLSASAKSAAESVAQRRLLDAEEGGADGYPSWVSSSDRRLLAATGGGGVQPNAVVALDGSGQFKSINAALASASTAKKGAPAGGRFVIYVKAGIYQEQVLVKKQPNVFIYGDGQGKTIITGDLNVAIKKVKTSNSATIGVDSDGFMIKSCTIRNTAGPEGHQAVALRIAGENAVVFDCAIEAFQDTLYYHRGKQFYKSCVISGTVDFIFGNGRAIIQDSMIIARKPGPGQNNMITADGGLTPNGQHGVVLQNCRIVAEKELMAAKTQFKTYLGRPWKPYALTIYMQNNIEDFITPEGYSIFTNVGEGSQNQNTAVYGEYLNTGPGANTAGRNQSVFKKWHLLSPQEANGYTVGTFLQGAAWLGATGVPYKVGM
ncbi:esterase [Lithospermum erythrorhizon]|uniref:Pectinesterase n=1 Tax=Lithospermum erythrorhizon TaxID=34254 RepID=A0AAV3NG29_LITER